MPIQVFTSSGGTSAYLKLLGGAPLTSTLTSVVDQADNVTPLQLATASIRMLSPTFLTIPAYTNTIGSKDGFFGSQSINIPTAGSAIFKMFRNDYSINNLAAQTGSVTGYFLNATETNLNGMIHNLMDLQVGGVSKFLVERTGRIYIADYILFNNGNNSLISSRTNGNITLTDSANSSFGRLQLGGVTSSFPAIKRNGAAIDFRLADDSGFCNISANNITTNNVFLAGALVINSNGYIYTSVATNTRLNSFTTGFSLELNATSAIAASAILDLKSTTQGFLMPRMTEAQILLITLPANGLMVYNTDINTPCFYDGGALLWKKVSHSNM